MNITAIEITTRLTELPKEVNRVIPYGEGSAARAIIPVPADIYIGTPPKAKQICHLLAAAPDMFRAAQDMLTHYEDRRESMSITELRLYKALEDALAKANGIQTI